MLERTRYAVQLNAMRLERFPGSPFFGSAERELQRIEARLERGPPIDREFYDGLNVGVMCARELEAVDMEYCDAIYAMLDEIRPSG